MDRYTFSSSGVYAPTTVPFVTGRVCGGSQTDSAPTGRRCSNHSDNHHRAVIFGFLAVVTGDIILVLPFAAVDFGILAVVTGNITLTVPFIVFGPLAHVNEYLILIGPFVAAVIFY